MLKTGKQLYMKPAAAGWPKDLSACGANLQAMRCLPAGSRLSFPPLLVPSLKLCLDAARRYADINYSYLLSLVGLLLL